MKIENSETLQCLINAFAGESQARNKYTIYSKIAKKEGYHLVSEIFLETAENEKEPMGVKVGDIVLYAKYAGTEIKMDGVEYKILSIKDALAIVE